MVQSDLAGGELVDFAPRSGWIDMNESDHFVQFYETDDFLLNSLGDFIGTGLSAGDSSIVVARRARREGLAERLRTCGLDVDAASASGQYLSLDAAETLSQFMVDGQPEPLRFAEVIGDVITRAAQGGQRVRIFGEMVALLGEEGNHAAAIRLEELWNELS
ncbi:MAG TPA: MEDS domain-containing protein, partial [Pyrinomonadaceae bacterium]|nr:MEDS domain-containing protein [Pyrinomonadaceae bacterium]